MPTKANYILSFEMKIVKGLRILEPYVTPLNRNYLRKVVMSLKPPYLHFIDINNIRKSARIFIEEIKNFVLI